MERLYFENLSWSLYFWSKNHYIHMCFILNRNVMYLLLWILCINWFWRVFKIWNCEVLLGIGFICFFLFEFELWYRDSLLRTWENDGLPVRGNLWQGETCLTFPLMSAILHFYTPFWGEGSENSNPWRHLLIIHISSLSLFLDSEFWKWLLKVGENLHL